MDIQIRIPTESHKALKDYAAEHGMTMKAAAELAISGLSVSIVVAVNQDGSHDIVEAYAGDSGVPHERLRELEAAGFSRSRMSETSTWLLAEPAKLRKYGPGWNEAMGWTPLPRGWRWVGRVDDDEWILFDPQGRRLAVVDNSPHSGWGYSLPPNDLGKHVALGGFSSAQLTREAALATVMSREPDEVRIDGRFDVTPPPDGLDEVLAWDAAQETWFPVVRGSAVGNSVPWLWFHRGSGYDPCEAVEWRVAPTKGGSQ